MSVNNEINLSEIASLIYFIKSVIIECLNDNSKDDVNDDEVLEFVIDKFYQMLFEP